MFRALIFDFDGVITDTEPVHMKAWLEVFRPLKIKFDKEEYEHFYIGLNDRDFLDAVGKNHGRIFPNDEKNILIEKKLARTLSFLEKNVPLIPGVREFIDRALPEHLLAICSGASRKEILFALEKLGWLKIFDPIVTQEDVANGKPNPEGYNLACKKLSARLGLSQINSKDFLAIEDSPKGIAAAHAAGLKCLAISNSFKVETLKEADWVVSSLSEFKLE